MMKFNSVKIILFLSILLSVVLAQNEAPFSIENQLDINNATQEDIQLLPVPAEIARALYDRVLYRGYFKSIYELLAIKGLDQELFEQIKPLIRIEPYPPKTTVQEKIEQIYFRLDQWSSSEGVNDAFVDLWIEKALDPMNVNNVRYDQLVNLQNVSPIDAAAIINYRNSVHWLRDDRDLRRTPELSNYAYRTARYFLDYKDPQRDYAIHGNILARLDNTPFMADAGDQAQEAGLSALSSDVSSGYNLLPNMYFKGRFSIAQNYKFGLSYFRNLNEPYHYFNDSGVRIPEGKMYFGVENLNFGPLELRKLYVGNYNVTLGQGVVMESTDFFTPRKSGYGFRKRFQGISGDNSKTREFTLRGIAAELAYDKLSVLGFFSHDSRDAIINRADGSVNQFIIIDQRFQYALDDSMRGPGYDDLSWLDAVNERTYGWHVQYDFLPGTYLGLNYYESLYDRQLNPDPYEIIGLDYKDESNWDLKQVTTDSEIKAAYGGTVSRASSPLWDAAQSFRRVYGFDFQTVINKVVLQGEYGELDKGGAFFDKSVNPRAVVLSAYTQFPTLNFLLLYRNYDLGFDNPYQRSFSNYRRYKGTMYEDYYYLQSVMYGQLYENNPQPQAEEGFYLDSYYQMSRKITLRFQYDNWMRKADAAKMYRLVGTIDYKPVFPLSIQLRNKWQAREEDNTLSTQRYYKNYEFRGRIRARLSQYDNFTLMYSYSTLLNHPRPRIFSDIVLDGEAITANYIHNFNKYLKLSGMIAYYKGFLWNFEDTQFMVMDSERGALRFWLSLYARLNTNLTVRMKYTSDHHMPVSGAYFNASKNTQHEYAGSMFSTDWKRNDNKMYYLEFSYNF